MRAATAVILASGKVEKGILAARNQRNRALIPFNGKPMYRYVVDALKAAKVSEIIIVGHDIPKANEGEYRVVPGDRTLTQSLHNGCEATHFTDLLVCTVDLPFLTGEAVTDFMDEANETGKELCYGAVELACCHEAYPGLKRTHITFDDGMTLTGGNLVYLKKRCLDRLLPRLEYLYQRRKNLVALGRIFGWGTVGAIIASKCRNPRWLNKETLVSKASKIFSIDAGLIISSHPCIATDVDNNFQLDIAEGIARTTRCR